MNSEESRQQQAIAVAQQQAEQPVFNLNAKEFVPSSAPQQQQPTSYQEMLQCKMQQNFLHDQLVNQNNFLTAGVSEPWKAMPSSFFSMDVKKEPFRDQNGIQTHFELSQAQWNFVYQFYPEYSSEPYDLMQWLQEKALNSEKQADGQSQMQNVPIPQISNHLLASQQMNGHLSQPQISSYEAWKEAWKDQITSQNNQGENREQPSGENYFGFNMDTMTATQQLPPVYQDSAVVNDGGVMQELNWQHLQDDDEEFNSAMQLYIEHEFHNDPDNSSEQEMGDDDDLYDLYELQFDFDGAESEEEVADNDTCDDSESNQSDQEDGEEEDEGEQQQENDFMNLDEKSEDENDDQIMDNDTFNKLKMINWDESEVDFQGVHATSATADLIDGEQLVDKDQLSSLVQDEDLLE